MSRPLALAILASLAACGSVHERLSDSYLRPPEQWLVTPTDLFPDAEPFEIPAESGTITGWFVPAEGAAGRTVVLFNDCDDDVSTVHPYYRFVVEAGYNACVFDYRGFGRSKGERSLRSAFMHAPLVVDHVLGRSDVDPTHVAYYGVAFGAAVALYTAVRREPAALVLEDASSMRTVLTQDLQDRNAVGRTLEVGFLEFAGLPDGTDGAENAARLAMPSLWINGADTERERLRSALAAYVEMGGKKQLWVLPDTAQAPHSLLTHDGEYQATVAAFLGHAFTAAPERLAVDWERGPQATGGGSWWEVELKREAAGAADEPWAVQVCALDAAGSAVFENAWLDGDSGRVRVRMADAPGVVGAMRVRDAERAEASAWERKGTPLSRAGQWYQEHAERIDELRSGQPSLADAREFGRIVGERDDIEPLPPTVEAQLADVWAGMGRVLATAPDAEDRARGLVWLQRAVAAVPAHPERHYWPGVPRTIGFPQQAAVQRARGMLQNSAAGESAARRQADR